MKQGSPTLEKAINNVQKGKGKNNCWSFTYTKKWHKWLLPHFGIDSLQIVKLHWLMALGIWVGIGMARTDLRFQPKLSQIL